MTATGEEAMVRPLKGGEPEADLVQGSGHVGVGGNRALATDTLMEMTVSERTESGLPSEGEPREPGRRAVGELGAWLAPTRRRPTCATGHGWCAG